LTHIETSTRSVRDKDNKVARLQLQINAQALRVSELEAKGSNGTLLSIIQGAVTEVPKSVKREICEDLLSPGDHGSKDNPMDVDRDVVE